MFKNAGTGDSIFIIKLDSLTRLGSQLGIDIRWTGGVIVITLAEVLVRARGKNDRIKAFSPLADGLRHRHKNSVRYRYQPKN